MVAELEGKDCACWAPVATCLHMKLVVCSVAIVFILIQWSSDKLEKWI
jgi:hypothetical protein